jgi:hypothetical protein
MGVVRLRASVGDETVRPLNKGTAFGVPGNVGRKSAFILLSWDSEG